MNDLLKLTEADLAELPTDEVAALEELVADALAIVEARTGQGRRTKLPPQVAHVADRHFRKMNDLTRALEQGRIGRDAYDRQSLEAITQSFTDAYARGKGVEPGDLEPGDLEWIRRAAEYEAGFARKFGADIENEALRMPRAERARLYGLTVEGVAWHGRVESAGWNARIKWVLGDAEHCEDCLILAANGPYTKANLPTTPKAGDTVCKSRCKCHLEVTEGALSAEERQAAMEYADVKDAGLAELMAPPVVDGMREPSEQEQEYIDGLRNKINYHRRRVATLERGTPEWKEAVRQRAEFNAELIEFVDREHIAEAPIWSVDDVLDGRHLGRKAKRDIMARGLDGPSVDAVDAARLESMLQWFEEQTGEAFPELDPSDFEEAARPRKAEAAPVAVPYRNRERGALQVWNVLGPDLRGTARLLGRVLLAARGTSVQVAPFDDRVLARVGVWLEGTAAECGKILDELKATRPKG